VSGALWIASTPHRLIADAGKIRAAIGAAIEAGVTFTRTGDVNNTLSRMNLNLRIT
jgi:hypothetical protein